ncbi:MAG: DinB family protein [Cyclobacteriaceae bacterium]
MFFREIFEYHRVFNRQLADQLEEFESVLDPKLKTLFSHTINAQQIWNARINGGTAMGVNVIHTYSECRTLNEKNYQTTIEIISAKDLNAEISYSNSKGEQFRNTIRDILFHVANHTTHHRGQLIASMRNVGIEPIVTDYIFYKRSM